jgi:hypothetical protein
VALVPASHDDSAERLFRVLGEKRAQPDISDGIHPNLVDNPTNDVGLSNTIGWAIGEALR